MRKFNILIAIISILFLTVSTASAEIYVKGAGIWLPKQEVSVTPPGPAGDINFNIENSFGGYGDVGFYTPKRYFSFGVEGGFSNLRAFNPIAGVQDVNAEIITFSGKACAHAQNHTSFTPFACGGAGITNIDPSLSIPGGVKVQFNSVTASSYLTEIGLKYRINQTFSLIGGGRYEGTFDHPVVGVSGIPGAAAEINLDRASLFFGVEF